jgi:L-idonate 5-dehydrogenase
VVVKDLPSPQPRDGEVRLRMAFAGVCGSDLHYYFEGANGAFALREPLVPGHEVSGFVDHDPSGTLALGTRVTVHPATFGDPQPGLDGAPHLWPNGAYLGSASTWPHTQGGMSEYLVVRSDMVRVLPEGLPLHLAALAEPLAVALHGINVAGGVEGKQVLVSGAGPIGLLTAAAALAKGASTVTSTDILPGPLQRAERLGLTRTIRVGEDTVPAEAFDVVLECSGSPAAISASIEAVRRAGVVAQVGMTGGGAQPIELAGLVAKEARLVWAFRFNDEIDGALDLLAATPSIGSVITHVIPAAEAVTAFSVAKDSQASGKVLVSLWHDEPYGDPLGA